MHNTLVVSKCCVKQLASLLIEQVLGQIESSDLALADWVFTNCVGKKFHVLLSDLAVSKVQIKLTLGDPMEQVRPGWVGLFDNVLGLEVNTDVGKVS